MELLGCRVNMHLGQLGSVTTGAVLREDDEEFNEFASSSCLRHWGQPKPVIRRACTATSVASGIRLFKHLIAGDATIPGLACPLRDEIVTTGLQLNGRYWPITVVNFITLACSVVLIPLREERWW